MSFSECHKALSGLLVDHRLLWQQAAFHHLNLAWQQQYPALSDALLSLTNAQLHQLDENPQRLHEFLSKFVPSMAPLSKATALPHGRQAVTVDRFLSVDIPGRKWSQIQAFLAGVSTPHKVTRFVDWCAGKSHLGRTAAAHFNKQLRAIERDPALCDAGMKMAESTISNVCFEQKDVLQQQLTFNPDESVLALHACGDLHRTLIKRWVDSESSHLVLAPCCYHQWFKGPFLPISRTAKRSELTLQRDQVRLAVQEMVTAPERVRRQVLQIKQWRVAFDLLQREVRGVDEYLPTPSLPNSAVNWGAHKVITHLAGKKGLNIPSGLAIQPFITAGERRFAQIRRLELASHGFRRAIELWLVLDLACALEEAGAEVRLQEFCDRQQSPRNIQIIASR